MRILGKHVVHAGQKFVLAAHDLETSSGAVVRREFIDHPGAAVMLPLLDGRAGDRVVLVRNYRHVIDGFLLELPAGTLQPPESPEATARRELAEETGYSVRSVLPLLT